MSIINIVYTLVSNLYYSIYNTLVDTNANLVDSTIPEEKIPEEFLDMGISVYNTGYVKDKGFRIVTINYTQRRDV